jgi:hypothetical protein
VALREKPTRQHFDPKGIELQLVGDKGLPSWTKLHRETRIPPSRVPQTRILLNDWSDRKATVFFTFGGLLEAVYGPLETVYFLRTAAPVLDLTNPVSSIPEELATETELLLARLQAQWGRDDDGFARQLALIKPIRLYQGAIQSLINHCEASLAHDCSGAFFAMLREERSWLRDQPGEEPMPATLERLLAPPAG